MAFSTRRGRPRTPKHDTDLGTPELRFKHACGTTSEIIDLCLSRGLINAPQHRSAMHLRWLHTIRLGAPRLTTIYNLEEQNHSSEDDPQWRIQRELEYQEAVTLLRECRAHTLVVNVTIFNEMPRFFRAAQTYASQSHWHECPALSQEYALFIHGLTTLAGHWKYQ